jgi:glycolate oxidase iron-sulfur subunit
METRFTPGQLADPATKQSEAQIRRCVHCGFCTATCPTYVLLGDELDSPRGRIYLIKDMLENQRAPSAETVRHIDRCLSCLSCRTTCPSDVDYMRLIDHARAYVEARYRRPWPDRLYRSVLATVLPHPARLRVALRLAALARPFAGLAPNGPAFAPLRAMLGLAPSRGTPKRRAEAPPLATGKQRGRVALLQGCAEPVLQPQIQEAAIRVLARAGYEVVRAPGEGCCGALVQHMGREAAALENARRNVDAWSRLIEDGGLDAVVVTASGCGTTLKDYGHILRNDPAYATRAAAVSALARDFAEVVEAAGLPPVTTPTDLVVAYHPACSLQHGQAIRDAPQRLLRQAGYAVVEPREAHLCCGSAGVYNILQPQIATELRTRKVAALEARRPDVIAAGNIGCLVQIASGAQAPVIHTAELLDWATGGPSPPGLGTVR